MRNTHGTGYGAPVSAGGGVPFAELLEPFGHVGREVHETTARAGHAVRDAIERVVRWWEVSATVRALSCLDDRTLEDIGVRREDIVGKAREAVGTTG